MEGNSSIYIRELNSTEIQYVSGGVEPQIPYQVQRGIAACVVGYVAYKATYAALSFTFIQVVSWIPVVGDTIVEEIKSGVSYITGVISGGAAYIFFG